MIKIKWVLSTVLILCIGGLIICIFYLNIKSSELKANLVSLEDKVNKIAACDSSTLAEIEKLRFQEQSYISQQESNTSLILTCFGVAIAVFGVFSFSNFNHLLDIALKEVDEKIKKATAKQRAGNIDQQRKYNNVKHDLYNVRIRLNNTLIQSEWSTANNGEMPFNSRIMHLFTAVDIEKQNFLLLQEMDSEKAKDKAFIVNVMLQNFLIIFGDIKEHELSLPGFQEQASEILSNSKVFENPELTKALSILFAKINFKQAPPSFSKTEPNGKWESESSEKLTFKEVPPPKE